MPTWPQYVCAILEDSDGRLLMESRPHNARFAPGRLTCFGGRREADESPEECLRRELREELDWEPRAFDKRVELWVAGDLIAWFYHAVFDIPVDELRVTAPHQCTLVSRAELPNLPVSPWHAAVLVAWIEGRAVAELDT